MSELMSNRLAAVRARAPQVADAASLRARLALVPARATTAPRTPFAVLLFALAVAGVVGLLMFNTHMQQNAFTASALKEEAEALTAKQQRLDMELEQLRDPQRVALQARSMGMVLPATPAFLRLSDGRVIGEAQPASPDTGLFVRNFPAVKPAALRPAPRIVKVQAVITPRKSSADGRASAVTDAAAGKKKTRTATSD